LKRSFLFLYFIGKHKTPAIFIPTLFIGVNIAGVLSFVLKNLGRLMSISNIGQSIAVYGIQGGKNTPSIFNPSKADANLITDVTHPNAISIKILGYENT